MGDIASNLSSKVIFTSDNPRFEDPDLGFHKFLSKISNQLQYSLDKKTNLDINPSNFSIAFERHSRWCCVI